MSSTEDGWMRLYDEVQEHYYWYNTLTQESEWEEVSFEAGPSGSTLNLTAAEASQAKAFFNPDASSDLASETWQENSPVEDWAHAQQQQALGMAPPSSAPLPVNLGTMRPPVALAAECLTSDEDDEEESPFPSSGPTGQGDWANSVPATPYAPPVRKDVPNRAPKKNDELRSSSRIDSSRSSRSSSSSSSSRNVASKQPESSSDGREDDIEADAAPMLPPGRSRLRYLNVVADTKRDLDCYRGCFFFHAFVCETPLVLLEASLRCAASSMIGAVLATLAALFILVALAAERRRRQQLRAGVHSFGQSGNSMHSDGGSHDRRSDEGSLSAAAGGAGEEAAPEAMAWAAAKVFFRDAALCFAVVLTLSVVPCCLACGVYRDFQLDDDGDSDDDDDDDEVGDGPGTNNRDTDEEEGALGSSVSAGGGGGDVRCNSSGRGWHLRPIPTLLGPVDPRRFATVSLCGQGADARNANVPLPASDTLGSQDYLASTIAVNVTDASGSLDGIDLSSESSFRNRSDRTSNDDGSSNGFHFQRCWDIRGAVLLPPRNLDRGLPPAAAWLIRQLLSFCDAAENQDATVADGRGGYSAELAQPAASDSEEGEDDDEEEVEESDIEDTEEEQLPERAVELTPGTRKY